MDTEKMMMQCRIDNLQKHIDHLHGVITDYERQNAKLKAGMEAVKRERDAAIRDIGAHPLCKVCKHKEKLCMTWCYQEDFEWRGLCAENGGAEDA